MISTDKDNCNCDQYGDKSMDRFKTWRDGEIKKTSRTCFYHASKLLNLDEDEVEKIKTFPKCMIKLTRGMCNCDRNCVTDSFVNIIFDPKCDVFDVDNLFIDDNYVECSHLDKKVVDGFLVPSNETSYLTNSRKKFYDIITTLCHNNDYEFEKLQCGAYEIRDACNNNDMCMNLAFNKDFPKDCENEDYLFMIDELSRLVSIPNRMRGIIRKKRDTSHIDREHWKTMIALPTDYNHNFGKLLKHDIDLKKLYCTSSISLASGGILLIVCYHLYKNRSKDFKLLSLIGIVSFGIFICSFIWSLDQLIL